MKIYCVNLKRSPDRRQAMAKEFARHGLSYEFVDAVDGALLTDDEIKQSYCLWRTCLRRGYGLKRGEIGCALSHIGLWKRVIAENEPVIVFEDDITFCNGIGTALDEIFAFLKNAYGPALVKMSGWPGGNKETGKIISSNYLTGTYAYGLNVAAAKLLLAAYTPVKGQIDHYWYMVKYFGLQLFSYDKTVVQLIPDSISTIGDNRFAQLNSFTRIGFKVWRLIGNAIDRCLTLFERHRIRVPIYVYNGFGDTRYTRSANSYQKPRLIAENLNGILLADDSTKEKCWPELQYAVSGKIPLGCQSVYCTSGSVEMEFIRLIFRRIFLRQRLVLFCWDPPGIFWRDRKDALARIRVWVLSQLQSMGIACSVCTVFNLHRGFAERYLWKRVFKKCAFFPNGTRVADNQKVVDGVMKHIPHRIAISNTFMAGKGCFWLADRLAEAKHQVPDLSVVWVGADHGDLSAVRERLLAGGFSPPDLVHLGPAKHADALRLWASADIGFNAYPDQPSVKWNYVLKIPEFMSLGLPIVSVDLPGAHEYITSEVGILFAPNDAAGAVRALCSILSDSNRIDAYRAAALELVKEFNWSQINERIATTIKQKCEV